MRIYHRERAGRPIRIVWVLEETGVPYELEVMNREEGRGEEHLARHPLGRVPVLEDDEGFERKRFFAADRVPRARRRAAGVSPCARADLWLRLDGN